MTQPYFWTDNNELMASAFIRLEDQYSNNLELVKHELGHALGLSHSYDNKNIMRKHPMQ